MVALWAAQLEAAAQLRPCCPISMRASPSDSTPWTILFVLTLITLLPAILMAMTPLVRLLVVFHFLRQALGTQTAPSNPTLMGLALMMTWFLMTPVLNQVDQQAVEPYRRADHGHGGDRPGSPAGEALSAALRAREGPGPVYRGRPDSAPQHADDLPMRWWFRPTFSPSSRPGSPSARFCFCPFC
jgi:flagellar biosynthesis protein FliP